MFKQKREKRGANTSTHENLFLDRMIDPIDEFFVDKPVRRNGSFN